MRKKKISPLLIRKINERLASLESIEREKITHYRSNPIDYFVERLGVKRESIDWLMFDEYKNHKWDGSVNPFMKIMEGLVNNKWVGVESATGTGKTFNGALIVLWFLECFENSIVVTTAPKQDQLALHIWKEITKLFTKFGRGELSMLKLRMNAKKEDWAAYGFVAGTKAEEESATRAQGFHAEHLLIILEETPGVPAPVITALQNTCTSPHNLILAFGNPDNQYDNLHRFCMLSNVEYVRISALDHPNVVLDNPELIPGAASKEGIERMRIRYGEDNPLYLSRARGISPVQSEESLIKIEWLLNAKDNLFIEDDYALGVDPANSLNGDLAAIALGKGNKLLSIKDFKAADCNMLGKRDVFKLIHDYNIKHSLVGIDSIGVGAGTVNALKEMDIKVTSLAGSASPIRHGKEEKFLNLRAQMYWQLREDLRAGCIILPNDEKLFGDLTAVNWFVKNGKIIVEAKDEIKKRIGRSTNKGDAVVYWNWVRVNRGKNKTVNVY